MKIIQKIQLKLYGINEYFDTFINLNKEKNSKSFNVIRGKRIGKFTLINHFLTYIIRSK